MKPESHESMEKDMPMKKGKKMPKSPEAMRATMKSKEHKDMEADMADWKGGVDHFDERV